MTGEFLRELYKGFQYADIKCPQTENIFNNHCGGSPLDFANYPLLEELSIEGANVQKNLSLDTCSKIRFVNLSYMDGLESLSIGARDELLNTSIYRCNKLTSLDLSNAPKLVAFTCDENALLSSIITGGNPVLKEVTITQNAALKSLNLIGLSSLETANCYSNSALEQLVANSDPALKEITCYANALTSLDVSGLSALKTLNAMDNQLPTFSASGVSFTRINLEDNKLTELSATVGGNTVNMHVYKGKGGYVELFAFTPDDNDPSVIKCDLRGEDLPEPYQTFCEKAEGSGWPADQEWDDRSI